MQDNKDNIVSQPLQQGDTMLTEEQSQHIRSSMKIMTWIVVVMAFCSTAILVLAIVCRIWLPALYIALALVPVDIVLLVLAFVKFVKLRKYIAKINSVESTTRESGLL